MNEYVFWTLHESDSPESRCVNPAANGLCHIHLQAWPQETGDRIMYQFGRNNPRVHWGIQMHEFWGPDGYREATALDPVIREVDLTTDSIVVSEEGNLIGFLVGEHKVFWIGDFEEGGRFDRIHVGYEPDLIVEKYCEEQDENGKWVVCAEWDEAVPDNGRPKQYTVVYGILTPQPYSSRFWS